MDETPSSLSDVLAIALHNERRGYEILKDGEGAAKTPLGKATFEFLANEEINHMRLIEAFAGGPHAELLERARASLLEIEMSGEVAEQEFRQIQLIRRIERKNRELTTVSGAELARRIQELAELKRQRA